MNLRPLRLADITVVAQLFAESAPGAIAPAGAELPFLQVAERFGISLRHSRLIESAGVPVGVVLNAEQPDCDEVFTVHWTVRSALRGRGLGLRTAARMVREFADQGFAAGLAEVHEDNRTALRLCQWLGYEQTGAAQHWEGVLDVAAEPPRRPVEPIEREAFLRLADTQADLAHWRRRPGLLPRQLVHARCFVLGEPGQAIGGWAVSQGIEIDLVETMFWSQPMHVEAVLDAAAVQFAGRRVRMANVQQGSPLAAALQSRGLREMSRWLELRLDLDNVRRRGA